MRVAEQIGYPVVVRPSFVLGGRAMEIVYDQAALEYYIDRRRRGLPGQTDPHRQVPGGRHRDRCGRRFGRRETVIGGIMEHIEEAGIHCGDSACVLPPMSLEPGDPRSACRITPGPWPRSWA